MIGSSTPTSAPLAPFLRLRPLLLVLAVALPFVVGLSRPNAARPSLRGSWPLEGLLPFTLNPAATTAVLWSAIALGVFTVLIGLSGRAPAVRWSLPVGLGALALLTAPFGSGDHLNYAAYGRILLLGGDPWTASPIAFGGGHDPITSAVEEPWTTEPSVYGPFVTLLQAGAAAVGGTHLRLVVLAWQVLVVLAWLGVRAGLRSILDREHHGRIDVLWTLNPLVLTIALLGAHVDTIAVALAIGAVAAFARWRGRWGIVAAGALTGLAAGTKFTYAVIGLAFVLTWTVVGPECRTVAGGRWSRVVPGCAARLAWLLAGALPTLVLLHVWTGPHVYDQVGRARSSVSLASPWRLVLAGLRDDLGGGSTRSVISVAAMLLAVLFAALLLRRLRGVDSSPATAVLVTSAALTTAYSLAAPYTLPWYDLLAWAALPAVLPGLLDLLLVARLAIMAAAYVPGRVLGMTPEVQSVTLGLRQNVAPWLQLGVWVVTLILLVRASDRAWADGAWALRRVGARDGSERSSGTAPTGS